MIEHAVVRRGVGVKRPALEHVEKVLHHFKVVFRDLVARKIERVILRSRIEMRNGILVHLKSRQERQPDAGHGVELIACGHVTCLHRGDVVVDVNERVRLVGQIEHQEVAYGHTNVKIASSHAGITLGEDGATHQTMEDVALMRALPGMVVINPCDYNQTKAATIAAAEYVGPVYLRFGRPSVPIFTPEDQKFEIGKAIVFEEGKDVTIFATGHLVWEALQACKALEDEGISAEIIDIATIKPLDEEAVLASALKTKAVVVAEEHSVHGGLGELIAGVLARKAPTPMEFINGGDKFGQSGSPAELMKAYGLDAAHIVEAAKKAIARK